MSTPVEVAEAKVRVLVDVLREVWEFLDDRADADTQGDPPEYVPNPEMRLLGAVEEALREIGESL